MFELEFEDTTKDAEYKEAVQAVKNCLGTLPDGDRVSFLAILTNVLKSQIDRIEFEKHKEPLVAIDLAIHFLRRLKEEQPENFQEYALISNDKHFEDGISTDVPKEEINYFLMLFATDLLADEMEKKEQEKKNIC